MLAGHHRHRVDDPGHRLRIGVHIRRGDVLLGTDDRKDRGGVTLGQALHLSLRQHPWVDRHPTLRAAKREVEDRALPGHEHRQALDLVERDRWVEANPALARSAASGVLDAVAGVDLERAVIHLDRHRDDERALRCGEEAVEPGIEPERLRRGIEAPEGACEQLVTWVDRPGDLQRRHGPQGSISGDAPAR